MNKYLFLTILFLVSIFTAEAQPPVGSRVLPLLGFKDKAVENTLREISIYISSKPKGLRFPVSKVLFTETEGGFNYEVVGIDNTWANLFNYGEASYGYAIINNRLFVIMGLDNQDIDLNTIFFRDQGSKAFSKNQLPPTGLLKNPKWYYEYKDGLLPNQVKVEALEILDK